LEKFQQADDTTSARPDRQALFDLASEQGLPRLLSRFTLLRFDAAVDFDAAARI
jgi:hypothetical protein